MAADTLRISACDSGGGRAQRRVQPVQEALPPVGLQLRGELSLALENVAKQLGAAEDGDRRGWGWQAGDWPGEEQQRSAQTQAAIGRLLCSNGTAPHLD